MGDIFIKYINPNMFLYRKVTKREQIMIISTVYEQLETRSLETKFVLEVDGLPSYTES